MSDHEGLNENRIRFSGGPFDGEFEAHASGFNVSIEIEVSGIKLKASLSRDDATRIGQILTDAAEEARSELNV